MSGVKSLLERPHQSAGYAPDGHVLMAKTRDHFRFRKCAVRLGFAAGGLEIAAVSILPLVTAVTGIGSAARSDEIRIGDRRQDAEDRPRRCHCGHPVATLAEPAPARRVGRYLRGYRIRHGLHCRHRVDGVSGAGLRRPARPARIRRRQGPSFLQRRAGWDAGYGEDAGMTGRGGTPGHANGA